MFGGRECGDVSLCEGVLLLYCARRAVLYVRTGAEPIIRADSGEFAMASTLAARCLNTILDPVFIFVPLGYDGRGGLRRCWGRL